MTIFAPFGLSKPSLSSFYSSCHTSLSGALELHSLLDWGPVGKVFYFLISRATLLVPVMHPNQGRKPHNVFIFSILTTLRCRYSAGTTQHCQHSLVVSQGEPVINPKKGPGCPNPFLSSSRHGQQWPANESINFLHQIPLSCDWMA